MKKFFVKFSIFVLLLSVVLSSVSSYVVNAVDNNEYVTMNGLKPMSASEIDAHRSSLLDDMVSPYSVGNPFPSSADLSLSSAFPPIKDQGGINSCAAFAIVYYQFTFEVNGAKGISSQSETNQYSPNWPYYALIKDDVNMGTNASELYHFLRDFGALKWSDDPYDKSGFDYSMPWPTNTELVKNAMLTRLYNWNAIEISSTGTVITSNQDADLDEVKAALNYGKVLNVSSYWGDFATNEHDEDCDKTIYYRFGIPDDNGAHSLTIVGYDDNVTYDINGDGFIEAGERGAFKLANSYDLDFGDDGYFWVMYDALNAVSSVSGNWDDSDNRISAFAVPVTDDYLGGGMALGDNVFTYIYAEEKEPLLIAEVNLKPHSRSIFGLELLNKKQGDWKINSYDTVYGFQSYVVSENRTLFFDYEELIASFDENIGNNYWGIHITNSADIEDVVSSIKLIDNLGNTIKTMTQETDNGDYFSCNTNFQYGDMDYDEVLTSDDASLIMKTISNHSTISNLQKKLADYNQDGKVSTVDVALLMQAIQ